MISDDTLVHLNKEADDLVIQLLEDYVSFYNIKKKKATIDDEAGLGGVGGAKVVGDDALVSALVGEGDVPQVQDGGVLHHASGRTGRVVVIVLHLCVAKQLLVLTPRKGHWGAAAARGRAGETHVAAEDRDGRFRLHGDLGLRDVV